MPTANSSATPLVSPLAPVLGFTGLASFAAGTATLGIFFVTKQAYDFGAAEQYELGLLVGVTYTAGALAASRVRHALARAGTSARAMLRLLSLAMAALMSVPLFTRSGAVLFLLLGLYAPLTGLFWPLVEGYVSGGRRGRELRSAIGRFNMVWSVTLVPSFLCLEPLLRSSTAAPVFLVIALAHLVSLAFLPRFRSEPGAHEEDESHVVPRDYHALLRVHRVLHAMGYLVSYALSPYLPTLLEQLGVPARWDTLIASTWIGARVVTFVALERWHGWHGRWSAALVGTTLVLAGFGTTVLAPHFGAAGLSCVLLGLFSFGVGLATLYTAALYYVLEVGGSEGGGSHEALIGLGYSIGPACGLAVCGLERFGVLAAEQRAGALLVVIGALSLSGAAWAWQRRGGAHA